MKSLEDLDFDNVEEQTISGKPTTSHSPTSATQTKQKVVQT
jgi:hypothetical protein